MKPPLHVNGVSDMQTYAKATTFMDNLNLPGKKPHLDFTT